MGRACSTDGERRGAYRVLIGKTEGRKSLDRPWRRWEDNIKMDLRGIDWIDLVQDGAGGGLL
jgi:hypothetical protein